MLSSSVRGALTASSHQSGSLSLAKSSCAAVSSCSSTTASSSSSSCAAGSSSGGAGAAIIFSSGSASALPASSPLFQKQQKRFRGSVKSVRLHNITEAHAACGSAPKKFLDLSFPRRPKPTRGPLPKPDLNSVDAAYKASDPEQRFAAWSQFRYGMNFKRDDEIDFASLSEQELGRLLRAAAASGDIDALEEMLHKVGRQKRKRILDLKEPETGLTAAMFAAQEDHHRVLRRLLQEGANYRAIDSQNNTALDYARAGNSVRAATVLVSFNEQLGEEEPSLKEAKLAHGGFTAEKDDKVRQKFLDHRLGRIQFHRARGKKHMAWEGWFDNSESGYDRRLNYTVKAPVLWITKRGQQVLYVPKANPDQYRRSIPQIKNQPRPLANTNRPNYFAR